MKILKQLYSKISWRLRQSYFYKGIKEFELVIFDDYFPNPVTGFRISEFSELLLQFNSMKIIVTPITYQYMGLKIEDFDDHLKDYLLENPTQKNRVMKIGKINNINAKLFYIIFLNNAKRIVPHLNKNRINFIFTLYPGGGFKMNDNDSDHELKKIMSSSYFKGVIVNQQCIKNYLLEKRLCNIEQVHYLHGLPMLEKKLQFDVCSKLYYPAGKRTLDICFAAAKNLQTGKDKGYDLFIAAAKILHRASKEICFHVVGGFSEKEIDVTELGNTIKFYGYLSAEKLPDTLRFFDIILSPNRPNMLGAGSFDGFPLGASVEASLVGCVIIATDELHENKYYVENEEIIIIKPILEDIIDKIGQLTMRPEKIRQIGVAGMNKTKQLYSYKNQLEPRIEILKNAIRENKI